MRCFQRIVFFMIVTDKKTMKGGSTMHEWLVRFQIGGKTYEQVVRANSSENAKKMIQMQYSGQRIWFAGVKRVD